MISHIRNIPRLFVSPDVSHRTQTALTEGFRERVLGRVREMLCGLRGHDDLLQFQRDRMFLKCFSCGHETSGWELNQTPPTLLSRRDTRRLTIDRPLLIGARRVA
jgi:hypothetical protein